MSITTRRGRRAALAALAVAGLAPSIAPAAPNDYRFELAGPAVKSGSATIVKVRLVRAADGQPVAGAVIFRARFDMGPDGMGSMTAPAKPLPAVAGEPGVYSIETAPAMAGRWALTLSARVPGEAETVRGVVTVPVGR